MRLDGTLLGDDSYGKEQRLSLTPIPPKTENEIEAAAAADAENPPITPEWRARLRRVPRVKTLRRALGLTQGEFAKRHGIPIGTLQERKQGCSKPDQVAQAYVDLIAREPLSAKPVESSRHSGSQLAWPSNRNDECL